MKNAIKNFRRDLVGRPRSEKISITSDGDDFILTFPFLSAWVHEVKVLANGEIHRRNSNTTYKGKPAPAYCVHRMSRPQFNAVRAQLTSRHISATTTTALENLFAAAEEVRLASRRAAKLSRQKA